MPLPPRPRVPPVLRRALVIGALVPACGSRPVPRIGPPPPRIGAQIAACYFRGIVRDADGAPVVGAKIELRSRGESAAVTATDAEGKFAQGGSSDMLPVVAIITVEGAEPFEQSLGCNGDIEISLPRR